jgi:hypothetical protein
VPGDPLSQGEPLTLEAKLRQALQRRRAAQQQAQETREELARLMARARELRRRPDGVERGGQGEV